MRSRSAVTAETLSGQPRLDLDVVLLEQLTHRGKRVGDDLLHVDAGFDPFGLARFDLRQVEHLVDEPREPLGLLGDDAEEFLALRRLDVGVVEQDLGERADRGERRAQFVRHRRDEVVLQPVELLQPLVGLAQLGGRRLQLARLLLEPVAVDDHLRRLVEDFAHLVDGERLFLDHRGHHDARRGGADRAGELDLDVVHQFRVGDQALVGPAQALRARVLARTRCRPRGCRETARAGCRDRAPTPCRARSARRRPRRSA